MSIHSFTGGLVWFCLDRPTDRPTLQKKSMHAKQPIRHPLFFSFGELSFDRRTTGGIPVGVACVCVCGVEGRDLVQGGGLGSQKGGKVGNIDGESWTGVGSVGVY